MIQTTSTAEVLAATLTMDLEQREHEAREAAARAELARLEEDREHWAREAHRFAEDARSMRIELARLQLGKASREALAPEGGQR